jgi:hypothetical protein
MELELKHLAGYLPYDLKGVISTKHQINEVELTHLSEYSLKTSPSIHGFEYCSFSEFKPLLRPLSSLIKEIEVDGKRFVPMVELADIAYCDISDKNYKTAQDENSIGVSFNIENDENEFTHQVFAYSFTTKHFGRHLRVNPHQKHLAEVEFVLHQLELFEKLFEWHFDIYGLIDKGLAIEIKD